MHGQLIPNENINFQITQGTGTLSVAQATTTAYGETQVTLTVPPNSGATTQVTATSAINPNLNVTFNFTNSQTATLTFDDIMNKVKQNEDMILDLMADAVKTSNEPGSVPEKRYSIWQKGDKSKVQYTYPAQETHIIIETSDSINLDGTPFISKTNELQDPDITTTSMIESSAGDMYVLKISIISQQGFQKVIKYYVDYSKGVVTKITNEYFDRFTNTYFETVYSYIQINDIWVQSGSVTKIDNLITNTENITTETLSNVIINSGIPDSVFQ